MLETLQDGGPMRTAANLRHRSCGFDFRVASRFLSYQGKGDDHDCEVARLRHHRQPQAATGQIRREPGGISPRQS